MMQKRCFVEHMDAEMKDSTSHGLHLKYKQEEKEAITKEEEELARTSSNEELSCESCE